MVWSATMARRWRAGTLAVVAVVGLLASGCYLTEAQQMREATPDARPWFCRSSGTGGHHGDGAGLANPAYAGMTKGDLSWDDCLAVARSFDAVNAYAGQWPTKASAEAAGWAEQVQYATGMGTHHINFSTYGQDFDPGRPTFLQYGGEAPDSPLVGMSWWVRNPGGTPPAGFPGDNDWWHTHSMLCFGPNGGVIGDEISVEQCRFFGGSPSQFPDMWMVHAWVVPGWQNKVDVFSGAHPCLLAGGMAPAGDPCWAAAAGEGPDHGGGHSH